MKLMPKKKKGEGGSTSAAGFELKNDQLMQMMGGFTVLRLSGMVGMLGINLTKEDLLKMNAKLKKIKVPKKKK